jgi:hypothetical protein
MNPTTTRTIRTTKTTTVIPVKADRPTHSETKVKKVNTLNPVNMEP